MHECGSIASNIETIAVVCYVDGHDQHCLACHHTPHHMTVWYTVYYTQTQRYYVYCLSLHILPTLRLLSLSVKLSLCTPTFSRAAPLIWSASSSASLIDVIEDRCQAALCEPHKQVNLLKFMCALKYHPPTKVKSALEQCSWLRIFKSPVCLRRMYIQYMPLSPDTVKCLLSKCVSCLRNLLASDMCHLNFYSSYDKTSYGQYPEPSQASICWSLSYPAWYHYMHTYVHGCHLSKCFSDIAPNKDISFPLLHGGPLCQATLVLKIG